MAGYWLRYGARDDEDRARMHNGGPKGPERDSTRGYWWRVKEILTLRAEAAIVSNHHDQPGENNEASKRGDLFAGTTWRPN
jgi:hypothetical protein